jgi:hypothetical protein
MAYVVGVDVQNIEDNPVMYTITTLHEYFEKEGAGKNKRRKMRLRAGNLERS